jgi:hypothetical protein
MLTAAVYTKLKLRDREPCLGRRLFKTNQRAALAVASSRRDWSSSEVSNSSPGAAHQRLLSLFRGGDLGVISFRLEAVKGRPPRHTQTGPTGNDSLQLVSL